MQVIPAVDIRGGAGVQLVEGNPERAKFDIDPQAQLDEFVSMGARRVHLVDLDGAFKEEGDNRELIKGMIQRAGITNVQVGGGIRLPRDIDDLLRSGASKVIIGTRAVQDPAWLCWMASHYGRGRIMAGLDAKDGEVMVNGWQTATGISVERAARSMQSSGVGGIIYTDIGRDGHEAGPNLEGCSLLAELLDIELIASGGIATKEHLEQLSKAGVDGAIVGTAAYSGSLALKDLL